MQAHLEAFDRLVTIIDELREKCPWDKKQTLESLRHLTIEETYELADAILDGDMEEVKKELGDLMLHLVFYTRIASETKSFTMTDVLNGICEKLIHRHPHIYGDVEVVDEEEVKRNWEALKLNEGKKSVLEGVPHSLPSLVQASRIQDKVRGVGFDWENPQQVIAKIQEEIDELQKEIAAGDKEKMEEEFGDVLFSIINYGRHLGVEPETALAKTNKKFISRFQSMEKQAEALGKKIQDLSLNEMEKLWQANK